MAIAIANSVDLREREPREFRYLDIVGRYRTDVIDLFPQILGELVQALEAGPGDVLGALFHDLELHSKARGQYFTPYTLSRFMAQAVLGDPENVKEIIAQHGFVTAMEPACGAGLMVIALAEAMRDIGHNYQRHLHVTAIDIDPRTIHMAYVQLSLLHIPAHFMVGNALSVTIGYTGPYSGWMGCPARRSSMSRAPGRDGATCYQEVRSAHTTARCRSALARSKGIAAIHAATVEPLLTFSPLTS